MSATYTHTGRRAEIRTARRLCGRLYGHDIPQVGEEHALNVDLAGYRKLGWNGYYRSLCGKVVAREEVSTTMGDPIAPECRSVVLASTGRKVTCKRCLKIIGG